MTGQADAPAHWRAAGLREEFGDELLVLEHDDEDAARAAYPLHEPMSTTILAFHQSREVDGRPALVVERHGSLHLGEVAAVVGRLGLALVVARSAMTRISPRRYEDDWGRLRGSSG